MAFVRCFNCNQMAFATENQLIPFYRLGPLVELTQAAESMKQWMSSQAVFARLNGVAVMGAPKAYDFLFWSFTGGMAGFETHIMLPAVNTVLRELSRGLQLPSEVVNPEFAVESEDEAVAPTIPRETAQAQAGLDEDGVQAWLLRVPLYEFPYNYNGRAFRIIVEALSGSILVDRFPRRPMNMWLVFVLLAIIAFTAEGFVLWTSSPFHGILFMIASLIAMVMTYSYVKRFRDEDR